MDSQNKSYKVVYTIVERQRDGKKYWLRIGAGFENRDGSINIYLDAMPTNGTLQLRDHQSGDDTRKNGRGSEDDVAGELLATG
ncbi:MAG: hypothetical protein IPK60_08820 [Sandaracinaceae bacterium]|jgi:hypothetical protein|nr:hypothetical protein [Sandaracinaceae bacterium]